MATMSVDAVKLGDFSSFAGNVFSIRDLYTLRPKIVKKGYTNFAQICVTG